ncbi:sugar kinase [soil metagenome]
MVESAMSPGRVVVIGELCADIIVGLDRPPEFLQEECLVSDTRIVMGSSSAITACGLVLMGIDVSMVGVVGDDLLGRFVLDELRSRRVDVSACRTDPQLPTGSSTILTLPDGDRTILTALGSIGQTRVEDVPGDLVARCARVHVGSYFLQLGLHGHLDNFFESCRQRGIATSVDPNFDPANTWDRGIADVLPHTDVFFCNEQEARAIASKETPDQAVAWFCEQLPATGELVVKLGPDGAYVACGGTLAGRVAVGAEDCGGELVDTVGAGDSLAAGYLASRMRGFGSEAGLRVGVRNGTASTSHAGGTAGQLDWQQASDGLVEAL